MTLDIDKELEKLELGDDLKLDLNEGITFESLAEKYGNVAAFYVTSHDSVWNFEDGRVSVNDNDLYGKLKQAEGIENAKESYIVPTLEAATGGLLTIGTGLNALLNPSQENVITAGAGSFTGMGFLYDGVRRASHRRTKNQMKSFADDFVQVHNEMQHSDYMVMVPDDRQLTEEVISAIKNPDVYHISGEPAPLEEAGQPTEKLDEYMMAHLETKYR